MRTKTRRGAQASQAFFSQRDEELHKFDELAEKTIYRKKVARRNAALLEKSALVAEEEADGNNSEAVYELFDSGSDYDSDGEPIVYIPRRLLPAYRDQMQASDKDKDRRTSVANALKLTKGSDPAIKDKLEFLLDESRACPQFLPMNQEDAIVSKTVLEAAALSEGKIPISELIRKEFYYECSEAFRTAISADAGLLKIEI